MEISLQNEDDISFHEMYPRGFMSCPNSHYVGCNINSCEKNNCIFLLLIRLACGQIGETTRRRNSLGRKDYLHVFWMYLSQVLSNYVCFPHLLLFLVSQKSIYIISV